VDAQPSLPLRRAVFLDRDGVLIEVRLQDGASQPPRALADIVVGRGVREGLRRLRDRGFLLIGATNQPDIHRGVQSREDVEAINAWLVENLELDDMRVCWHDDQHNCPCRKPKPGLLLQAAADYGIALESSYMVGDRWRDIEAGQAAHCRTVWIPATFDKRQPKRPADFVVADFGKAAESILQDAESRG